MKCNQCGKQLDKHDEGELLECLSEYFQVRMVDAPAVVGYLMAVKEPSALVVGWGQPHINTGTLLVEFKGKDAKAFTYPELLQEVGKRLLSKKLVADEEPTEELPDAIREDAPEDTP